MDALLSSMASPFEGILAISEMGLLLFFLIPGIWFSLHTVLTNKKE